MTSEPGGKESSCIKVNLGCGLRAQMDTVQEPCSTEQTDDRCAPRIGQTFAHTEPNLSRSSGRKERHDSETSQATRGHQSEDKCDELTDKERTQPGQGMSTKLGSQQRTFESEVKSGALVLWAGKQSGLEGKCRAKTRVGRIGADRCCRETL